MSPCNVPKALRVAEASIGMLQFGIRGAITLQVKGGRPIDAMT
jgi:hypothetical protein